MPTYDFYCPDCDKEFNVTQSIKDKLPTNCEECGCEIKQRLNLTGSRTATGLQAMERVERLAVDDRKRLQRGHDRTLSDLVGDKPNPYKQ